MSAEQQRAQAQLALLHKLSQLSALSAAGQLPNFGALGVNMAGGVAEGDLEEPGGSASTTRTKREVALASLWEGFSREINESPAKGSHDVPLARIRKIMKADEDVKVGRPWFFLSFPSSSES